MIIEKRYKQMSYEKVSSIRLNVEKNILEFKSHSNNDDADPTWWSVKGDTIQDKLLKAYELWDQGYIRFNNSIIGASLTLKYAFMKHTKENDLLDYVLEKDSKPEYILIFSDIPVRNIQRNNQFDLTFSRKLARRFTKKQAYVICNMKQHEALKVEHIES